MKESHEGRFDMDHSGPFCTEEKETGPPAGLNEHYNNSCSRPDDCPYSQSRFHCLCSTGY